MWNIQIILCIDQESEELNNDIFTYFSQLWKDVCVQTEFSEESNRYLLYVAGMSVVCPQKDTICTEIDTKCQEHGCILEDIYEWHVTKSGKPQSVVSMATKSAEKKPATVKNILSPVVPSYAHFLLQPFDDKKLEKIIRNSPELLAKLVASVHLSYAQKQSPRFERQDLRSIQKEVKQSKSQHVLFAKGKFKDGIFYLGHGNGEFVAHGYLQDEKDFMSALKNHGASLVPNLDVMLPKYMSWADVQEGFCLQIEKPGITITYTPHFIDPKDAQEQKCLSIDIQKHADQILKSIEKDCLKKASKQKDFFTFTPLQTEYGQEPITTSWQALDEDVKKQIGDKENIIVQMFHQSWHVRKALKAEIVGPWIEYQPGFYLSQTEFKKQFQLKGFVKREFYPLKLKAANKKQLEEWSKIHKDHPLSQLSEIYPIWDLFKDDTVKVKSKDILSPISERGRLKVEGKEPQRILSELEKLGVVTEFYKEVPYNLLSGTRNRVKVLHDDYLLGCEAPKLPPGHMILHGMTSTKSDVLESEQTKITNRLVKIIESGGLLSTRARRHEKIEVESLSPLGDIASGIDHGVPATLGKVPFYGSGIFFALKPHLLCTKEIWFSETDYGPGQDRSVLYDNYAQSLGLKNKFHTPDNAARVKHLERLQRGELEADNEIYFADEVCFADMDSIFVKEDYKDVLLPIIEKAKKNGLVPWQLNVETYNLTDKPLNKLVEKRSQKYI